ncbi:hypothetical protein KI387_024403, partial [Taxus chinensis]
LDPISALSSNYSGVGDSDFTHMDLEDLKDRMLGGPREPMEDKVFTSGLYAVGGLPLSFQSIELVLECSHQYEPNTQTIRA